MGGLTDGGHILHSLTAILIRDKEVSHYVFTRNVAVKLLAKVRKVQISGLLPD